MLEKKVTIRVSRAQQENIQRFIPRGMRQELFRLAVELVLNEVYKKGIKKATINLRKAKALSELKDWVGKEEEA